MAGELAHAGGQLAALKVKHAESPAVPFGLPGGSVDEPFPGFKP